MTREEQIKWFRNHEPRDKVSREKFERFVALHGLVRGRNSCNWHIIHAMYFNHPETGKTLAWLLSSSWNPIVDYWIYWDLQKGKQ